MSKEATGGVHCACGVKVAFPEYHWPHCRFNPVNMSKDTHGAGFALLDSLQTQFSKSELAKIATHGPMRDEKVGKRGKQRKMGVTGKRKSMDAK